MAALGIIVFVSLIILWTCFFNMYIKKSALVATILAAVASVISYQLLGVVVSGYLDPLWPVAVVTGFLFAALISSFVSWCFWLYRKKHE